HELGGYSEQKPVTERESQALFHFAGSVESGFQGQQETQRDQVQKGQDHGAFGVAGRHGGADHARIPDTGGGGRSVNVASAVQDGATPDKTDPGGQALNDARPVGAGNRVGQQNVSASSHGHQRERADADAVFSLFALPTDGQRQQV